MRNAGGFFRVLQVRISRETVRVGTGTHLSGNGVNQDLAYRWPRFDILDAMRHRFLLHHLNHTILSVDISNIGIPAEIISDLGESKTVQSIRFRTWSNAEQHFLGLGAEHNSLRAAKELLRKNGVVVLTIA